MRLANCSPYWVVPLMSSVMFSTPAPVLGVNGDRVTRPLTGAVRVPLLSNCTVVGAPIDVPSTYVCICHSFGLGVFT